MESTRKKHVEVEDKEILIKSSNGYMAIIPKGMAPWVREHIESGNHHIVDGYVKGLQEMKDGGKAQDGGKIPPPVRKDLIRPDGTMKDVGFLGKLKSPSGKDVTEYSVGVPIMGKEMDIPTLVPGLSKEEIAYVLQRADKDLPIGKDAMGNAIVDKAIQHATQRVKSGVSPFYSSVADKAAPKMSSDATAVKPTLTEKISPGVMLPAVEITAPAKPIKYDEINYLNPFDSKYAVTKALKKANTALGGNIEKGGYNRESYSDLISRLERTPGTIQNEIQKGPIPNISAPPFASPIVDPANLAINAFNVIRPNFNRAAAAVGDVALDPANRIPVGRAAKTLFKGASTLAGSVNSARAAKLAKGLEFLSDVSPTVDNASDVIEIANSYSNYTDKPKTPQPVVEDLTPEQKRFLEKASKYNFSVSKK